MYKKTGNTKAPIVGLFVTLALILAFPLLIFVSQNQQNIRQEASAPQPTLNIPQQDYNISGYVYQDSNTDGQRQYGEKGVNNVQLKITQKNLITFITTDENGYFKYKFSTPDTFTIQLILPTGYKTINTNPRRNIQNNTKNILEFGIFPISIGRP